MKPKFQRLFQEAAEMGGDGGGGAPASAAVIETPAVVETPASTEAPPAAEAVPEWFPAKYVKDGKPAFEELAKGYQELQKAFSSKNPMAAQVPESPDGYQLKPEKIPEGLQFSDEAAGKFAEVFHKNGIPAPAAKAIADTWLEMEAANMAKAAQVYEQQLATARQELEAKWGGAEEYAKITGKVSALVTDTLGEDPGDAVLFSNPRVVEFLAKVSDLLGPDAVAAMKDSVSPGAPIVTGAAEAKRIMSDPQHPEHARYMAGEPDVVRKVQRLIDQG